VSGPFGFSWFRRVKARGETRLQASRRVASPSNVLANVAPSPLVRWVASWVTTRTSVGLMLYFRMAARSAPEGANGRRDLPARLPSRVSGTPPRVFLAQLVRLGNDVSCRAS
jgi:hypothetical protein